MSETTAEKSDIEKKREALMAAYLKGEQAKMEEIARNKNPSQKQKVWADFKKGLRAVVEGKY